MYPEQFASLKEELQKDLICYFDNGEFGLRNLLTTKARNEIFQIVVDSFKKFEK